MAKTITIASGKGGVGKTSITSSLAVLFSRTDKIVAVDADIDASNLALLLNAKKQSSFFVKASRKALIDEKKCTNCGLCYENCKFNAIIKPKEKNEKYRINKYFCEGCNTCSIVCPAGAISFYSENTAEVSVSKAENFYVVSGQLIMGQSGSGKVVDAVKEEAKKISHDIMLVDAAAGIGCPVIASLQGSDFIVAVTEPTPSAFSDLQRLLQLAKQFNIEYGIIINKADLNKRFTEKIVSDYGEKILAKINYSRSFIESMTQLKPIIEYDDSFIAVFEDIKKKIIEKL